MTAILVVFACSLVVAVLAWRAMGNIFDQPLFARQNYRGRSVPVAAGLVLVVTVIVMEAATTVVDLGRTDPVGSSLARITVLLVTVGFGLLGAVDDLAASGDDRGFTGHLRAMARGRLTTGGLKLAGGGLIAIIAVRYTGEERLVWVLVDALLIALGANTANLFDRAPGRTIKVAILCFVPLLALAAPGDRSLLVGVAAVVGASVGLLSFDLREHLMLGDAGSNVMGAALAVGLVLTTGPRAHLIALVVVVALNLASERVSFSRVIDRTAPLRHLDRLGRHQDS